MLIGLDHADNSKIDVPSSDTIVLLGRNDNILRQLVLETDECLFIDTRGVDVISYTPRVNDTIYFKANDRQFPIAFNPLCSGNDDNSLEILNTFRTIYGTSWGPQLEMILTASTLFTASFPPTPTTPNIRRQSTTAITKNSQPN